MVAILRREELPMLVRDPAPNARGRGGVGFEVVEDTFRFDVLLLAVHMHDTGGGATVAICLLEDFSEKVKK